MATITVKNINDKNIWENFISQYPEANFLQSWSWGEFHQNLGATIFRTGFFQDEKLAGVMLSIVEKAKRGRYLTVPGGPILNWDNQELVDHFVQQLKKLAQIQKCVFVRVRPQLIANTFAKELFSSHGFINSPMHLHAELTVQLNLTQSEGELLKQMRKNTRYEIKKAESIGIEITTSQKPDSIKDFYNLQIITAKRHHFVPFSFGFLHEQFRVFARNQQALLYQASLKGQVLAQAMVIFCGSEAVYHYGASTEAGRKYPGSYLIQWEAIKEAKKRGIRRYNLWGVSPLNQTKHRFYRISLFKRGFGGEEIEYLHAQDLVINRVGYWVNYLVETIRKIIRGL
ncbi:peptidoglycan bridge formation glycyltransferase FemA/FemB family protein [Candidatus Daviesbacteria bacterium]|nr:peptidoglycan bridge formation glycyltransferase FemA/FemB family protein [Candidatus Daviesbacteria bacterium]